jgi:hypothetical protein
MLAQSFSDASAVECTIRKPIPMEQPLQIELRDGKALLLDGEETVIEASPTDYNCDLPQAITREDARRAVENSPAFHNHPFPSCFVCGPERAEHDGLRVFPGPATPQEGYANLFAASWVPAREFADEHGIVRSEFIWAAMDCPTGFAAGFPYEGTLVTGRLGVKLLAPIHAEKECVLMSWSLGKDGRKCHATAVLYNADRQPCAIAKATWIKLGSSK